MKKMMKKLGKKFGHKIECPLGHDDTEGINWCLDCRFAKEGLCDWPHPRGGSK